MKKCPYCGKEYADDIERCLIDDELLSGGEPPPAAATSAIPISTPAVSGLAPTNRLPGVVLTDRQLRIFELVLVCVIAFGASIFSSTYHFLNTSYGGSSKSELTWITQILHEGSILGLLWYVLMRRGRTFSDLGVLWALKDAMWGVLLIIAARYIFHAVYRGIYFTGLTSVTQAAASDHVGQILFGGGITCATILFQFLNPFFEELIARAYVMTEVKALTNSAVKAIIVSTVLQTSYHFYQGAPAALADGSVFLLFAIFYAKTNRIVPVILAHLYMDVSGTAWYFLRH
jgi:membrane protease YdiL (CAAX protease family)